MSAGDEHGLASLAVPPTAAIGAFGPVDSLGARLLAAQPRRVGGLFGGIGARDGAVQTSARLGEESNGATPEYFLRNADNPDEWYALGGQEKYSYISSTPLKWSTLVSWRYNPANQSTLFSQADILAALGRATAKWSAVCNVRFSYEGTTTQSPSMSSCDGANIVGWAPLSGGTVGRTQACWSGGYIKEFDLVLDSEQPYQLGSLGLVESVATHEYGHAIGLGHTSISPAVMTSSVTTGTLVQDDINGCVSLYGAAQSTTDPVASLSKTSVSFASQLVGTTSAVQTVRLTNAGGGSLTISGLSIGGAHPGDFGRAGTCASGTTLAAGQYCDMSVTFTPLATGTRTASLAVSTNAASSAQSVALAGTGADPVPMASLSVSSLSFGSVAVGTSTTAKTVRVTNSGGGTLSISGVSLGGANPGDFSRNGCNAGTSLAAGAWCDVAVSFAPVASGTRSATLALTTNASSSPSTVALSGSGVILAPAVSLSSSSLLFGDQTVGTTSTAKSVTLTNTGSASLTISSIAKSGTHSAEFVVGGTCPASGTLAAGASCTVQAQFAPVGTGTRSATVTITTNAAGSPHAVALSGNGVAAASTTPAPTPVAQPVLSASSLVFGTQTVGTTSAAKTVTLSNTGSAAMTLSSVALQGTHPSDFAISGTCVAGATVAAGGSCTSSVTFRPTASGTRSASIAYATSAGTLAVAVSGTGADSSALPVAKYSSTSLTFADQVLGTTSRKRSISLTNRGTGTLVIQQLTLGGANPQDFQVSGNCSVGRTLAFKSSCSISVTFSPSVLGLRTADITVLTNASATAQRLALSGNGVTKSSSSNTRKKAAVADVVEYYNPDLDHYFVTAFEAEIEALDAGKFPGWVRTGQLFGAGYSEDGSNPSALAINSVTQTALAQQPSLTPVCRFYGNPARGLDSHFYSASPAECSQVLTRFPDDWLLESEAVLHAFLPTATGVCPAGTLPVYRLWNQRADVNHRYTTDADTRAEMIASGWVPEGYGPEGVSMCIPAD